MYKLQKKIMQVSNQTNPANGTFCRTIGIVSKSVSLKYTEDRLMNKGMGEKGEGEINGKSSMEAYILPYVK